MGQHYSKRKDSKGRSLYFGEYQRPTGTYQYKYKDKKGIRQSISAESLDELRTLEEQIEKDVIDGINTSKQRQTVNDMYEVWKDVKRGLKANVRANYIYMYVTYVMDDIGKMKLRNLKKTDIRKFYNSLRDSGKLAVSTLDCVQTVLHQVLDLAVDDDIIRYNPADKALRELKAEERKAGKKSVYKKRHEALTLEEQKRLEDFLLHSPTYRHWYPIITLMMNTGMRVGEATSLRWEDVDFDKGFISVNHDMVSYTDEKTGKYTFKINDTTKTAAGMRTIPITKRVAKALKMQKKYMKGMECKTTLNGYTDFIFLDRFGYVLREANINKALRERIFPEMNAEADAKGLIQVHRITCHGFRHTFCTNLCRSNVPIKTIMAIMGHEDIRTTMQIYAEATADMKKNAADKLEDYLGDDAGTFETKFETN